MRAESGPLNFPQELFRNNRVGVDIHAVQRGGNTSMFVDRFHYNIFRISTIFPSIAASATISGLIKCVRPPGPWRPSKLRLLDDAQRSPVLSWSSFMPKH